MGKQINRRGLGTSTGALTLGVAAGSTALMSKALGQGIEVGGQAYVAIKVAMWQLTVDCVVRYLTRQCDLGTIDGIIGHILCAWCESSRHNNQKLGCLGRGCP